MLKKNGFEKSINEKEEYPVIQTKEGWIQILTNIQNDDILMSPKITNGVDNSDIQRSGMRVACFVDKYCDATVVFRGTSNASEWHNIRTILCLYRY